MNRLKDSFVVFLIIVVMLIFNTKCIFKLVIGVPCPGCGLTRAWISCLKGDILKAFNWHPLFLLIPILGILIFLYFKKSFIKCRIYILILICIIVSLYLITYIFRMMTLFPYMEPLDYNSQSFINQLIYYIKKYVI